MPTQSSIPNLESQIGNLQSSADATKASISSDYGGESPSPSAISRQQSLFNIQNKITKLNDQRLRQKWYPTTTGDTTTEPTAPPEGIVGKALDVISTPLYGVVGAARHAVGQGTTGSLGGDVMENIQKSKKTFGSMLSEAGVNGPVSAVAGFGLDVMFDPVNWMTMGTSALIPKVARGIIGGAAEEGAMGALRGARAAATVRGAEVAGTLGKWSPGAFGLGTKIIDKIPLVAKDPSLEGMTWTQIGKNTLRGLAEKNVAATAEYERLTGDTMAKRLAQRGFGVGEYRFSPGDWTAAFMLSHPDSNATKFLDAWKYKTSEYVAQARRTDVIQKAVSPEALRAIQAAKNGEPIESVTMTEALKNLPAQIDVAVKQLSELPSGPSTEVKTIAQKYFGWEPSRYVKEIDDTAEILKAYNLEYTPDWQSKLNRFIVDIGEEQNRKIASLIDERGITRGAVPDSIFSEAESVRSKKFVDDFMLRSGITGVKWYDNMMQSARDFKVHVKNPVIQKRIENLGSTVLDNYDRAMSLFRSAKVSTPTGIVNQMVSNVTNTHLMGVLDKAFIEGLSQTNRLYHNKPNSMLFESMILGEVPEIVQEIIANKRVYEQTTGQSVHELTQAISWASTSGTIDGIIESARRNPAMVHLFKSNGVTTEAGAQELRKVIAGYIKEAKGIRNSSPEVLAELGEAGLTKVGTSGALREATTEDVPIAASSMLSQELYKSKPSKWIIDYLDSKLGPSAKAQLNGFERLGLQVLDFTFKKMTEEFEKGDQIFKYTFFRNAVTRGFTEPQLMKLKNYVKIDPTKLVRRFSDGEVRYPLPFDTAMNLANVAYMNYAAMPAGIRVLRNMPILSSPFASFMYAMAAKTGQTMMYNPSAFNKIGFAQKEFGGQASPLEKQAIYDPSSKGYQYYSYLGQPGMQRLPFFEKNPVYLNLTNVLPYYGMNIFNPSQADYGSDTLPNSIAEKLNSMPVLQDPFGQYLKNYLIIPALLADGVAPQSQFGQQLYPADATAGEKAAYGVRDLAESFAPGTWAIAGVPAGLSGMSDSAIEKTPLYRFRSLARAVKGETAIGITGKESAPSRTIRGTAGYFGLPIQAPIDLTYNQK